ncbi:MAG TPA: hypothetical protein VFS23_17295, partial [Vicinamibacterales bacterium]|nr:hypothetical protein [Vicinamibacterales bacterium]
MIAKMPKDVVRHAFGVPLLVTQTQAQDAIVADPASLDLIAHGFDDIVPAVFSIEDGHDVPSQIRQPYRLALLIRDRTTVVGLETHERTHRRAIADT